MKDLHQNIDAKLITAFPNGIPSGVRIFESDIREAENGNFKRFTKVVNAIYTYLDVPSGFFGEPDPYQIPDPTLVKEDLFEYKSKIQQELLEARQKIIELQEQLLNATQENKALSISLSHKEEENRLLESALMAYEKTK